MTKSSFLASVATVVAAASLAAAVYEYRAAWAAQMALAGARREQAAVRRQRDQEQAKSIPTAPAPRTRRGAAAESNGGAGRAALPSAANVLDSPRFQRLISVEARGRLDLQYAALFKALNLSPQQVQQFKNLLLEKQNVAMDSINLAREQGIDPVTDPRGFYQAVATAEGTVDTQIGGLLGPDGLNQFQQYLQGVPAHNTSNLLQQSLSYTTTPLTDDQAARLTQVLTQYDPPWAPNFPFATLNADLGVTHLNDATVTQLQGVLTPAQMENLTSVVQLQNQILQARRRAAR